MLVEHGFSLNQKQEYGASSKPTPSHEGNLSKDPELIQPW
jgi:hypothetical protein